MLKELARVARHNVAHAENRGAGIAEHALEPGSPLGQRQRPKVFVVIAQDVERDERDAAGGRSAVRFSQVNAILQPLKSRRLALLVERDDFAVEHDRAFQLFRVACESGDEIGKLSGLLVASRDQMRTGARRPGSISTSARMPSYFGS